MNRLRVSWSCLCAVFCLAPLLLVACDPATSTPRPDPGCVPIYSISFGGGSGEFLFEPAPGSFHSCSELEVFLNDPNMKLAVPGLVVNYPDVAPEQFRVIYDPGESMFDADTGFRVEDALVQCPHLTFPSDVGW